LLIVDWLSIVDSPNEIRRSEAAAADFVAENADVKEEVEGLSHAWRL